jgi:VWFA-related protein
VYSDDDEAEKCTVTAAQRRRPSVRRLPPWAALSAAAAALAGLSSVSAGQEPQAPSPFRTGTNVVRVDATVIDRGGNPVTSLTADDFEVREDGKLQTITSFRFVAANGEAGDDRSLPIRSQQHAAAEAARDDVRTFLIFWDEYHIEQFVSAQRGREALARAVLEAFGPTDLVAVMDPLTPLSAIEFTRDRRALADHVHRLTGRLGVYFPFRGAAEEEQFRHVMRPEHVEVFRNQVTISAIRAAAAHLGTLREGRKTMVVMTEGLGPTALGGPTAIERLSDQAATAASLIHTANDSNTAIHVVDPRGLRTDRRFGGLLDSIAEGTGGQLHMTNDLVEPFRRAVEQASALYLLGYTRDMATDGKFHEIKVRVKRDGLDVRARAGYWAPRAEDVERAKRAAGSATLPAPVAAAFASLTPVAAPRLVDLWAGTRLRPDGSPQVTLAWTARSAVPRADTPATVVVSAKSGPETVFEGHIEPGGTSFEAPAGALKLSAQILGDAGEVLDRSSMAVEVPGGDAKALSLGTPVVHRARTPAEVRAILTSPGHAPVHAGREFGRTDRLIVRVIAYGASAAQATVAAALLDRRGVKLVDLPARRLADGTTHQLDLPVVSIAAGEYVLAIESTSAEHRAWAHVGFRVAK